MWQKKLSALLGIIRLQSWVKLSHYASCTARQVYANRKRKCFNSKVLCSSPETTTSVIHTSSIAIRSLLSAMHTNSATTSRSCRNLSRYRANECYLIRRSCSHSIVRASTCLNLILRVGEVCTSYRCACSFAYLWSPKENFGVSPSEHGGLTVTDTKVDGRPAHGEGASHFAVRYVVLQCCHYQRSAAVVLENVAFGSRRLF